MTILEFRNTPDGEPGAKCEWIDHGTGHAFESVFPLRALTMWK